MRIMGHRFSDEHVWMVVGGVSALAAGFVGRKALESGWKAARGYDPPLNPESWDTTWADAIAWTLATGVVIGFARLLGTRGATAVWTRAVGRKPPI